MMIPCEFCGQECSVQMLPLHRCNDEAMTMTNEEILALAGAVAVIVTHADRHDRITLTKVGSALRQLAPLAEIGARWNANSSLEDWFPLTAEELARVKAELAALREERDREERLFKAGWWLHYNEKSFGWIWQLHTGFVGGRLEHVFSKDRAEAARIAEEKAK